MNALIEVAMSWLDRGIATIPISYRSKRPSFSALMKTGDIDAKGEPTWERMKTGLPTPADFEKWYTTASNIAVVTGQKNLVIVDFDKLPAYDLWMQLYGIEGYADTYTVHTGRGYHLYYFIEDMPEHTMKWAGGEVKASGYCLIPPSVHPSGAGYKATCPDIPIMDIGSIYELLPEDAFKAVVTERGLVSSFLDPIWSAPSTATGNYSDINQRVRISSFFPDAAGNGRWRSVICPLHNDGAKHGRASGWIDTQRNRYGCHFCVNGSLSAIDFYAAWRKLTPEAAAAELSGL